MLAVVGEPVEFDASDLLAPQQPFIDERVEAVACLFVPDRRVFIHVICGGERPRSESDISEQVDIRVLRLWTRHWRNSYVAFVKSVPVSNCSTSTGIPPVELLVRDYMDTVCDARRRSRLSVERRRAGVEPARRLRGRVDRMNANDPNPRKSGGMTMIRDEEPIEVGAYRALASPIAEVRA